MRFCTGIAGLGGIFGVRFGGGFYGSFGVRFCVSFGDYHAVFYTLNDNAQLLVDWLGVRLYFLKHRNTASFWSVNPVFGDNCGYQAAWGHVECGVIAFDTCGSH